VKRAVVGTLQARVDICRPLDIRRDLDCLGVLNHRKAPALRRRVQLARQLTADGQVEIERHIGGGAGEADCGFTQSAQRHIRPPQVSGDVRGGHIPRELPGEAPFAAQVAAGKTGIGELDTG
jgi:hypothetical protein